MRFMIYYVLCDCKVIAFSPIKDVRLYAKDRQLSFRPQLFDKFLYQSLNLQ